VAVIAPVMEYKSLVLRLRWAGLPCAKHNNTTDGEFSVGRVHSASSVVCSTSVHGLYRNAIGTKAVGCRADPSFDRVQSIEDMNGVSVSYFRAKGGVDARA
jgi:hypothetical protein